MRAGSSFPLITVVSQSNVNVLNRCWQQTHDEMKWVSRKGVAHCRNVSITRIGRKLSWNADRPVRPYGPKRHTDKQAYKQARILSRCARRRTCVRMSRMRCTHAQISLSNSSIDNRYIYISRSRFSHSQLQICLSPDLVPAPNQLWMRKSRPWDIDVSIVNGHKTDRMDEPSCWIIQAGKTDTKHVLWFYTMLENSSQTIYLQPTKNVLI